MEKVYSESFFLSAGEVNAEADMSLTLLVSKLIDIATAHANSLGIGNPNMASMNAGWILSRITVEMTRYPKVNEDYTISTWVESWNRHFSVRCFSISLADGTVCGYARSIWMVMTTDTHSNAGLSHLNFDMQMIPDLECPIARQEKHIDILPYGKEKGESTRPVLLATHPDRHYVFKYTDIDYYRHVNTVRYVSILLNQYSLQDFDDTRVRRLELSFLNEGHYGAEVAILRSDSSEDALSSSFLITGKDEPHPILYARLVRENR